MEVINNINEGIIATSALEWLAVGFSLLYVFFAAKKSIWCWICALIASGIYVILCFKGQLYIEAGLQFFYLAMAIYGWVLWKKAENDSNQNEIIKWPLKFHLYNLFLSSALALLLGFFFDHYTKQANSYLDAFITCFSLAATYMISKKVIETWLYWVVIDFASIFLYAGRELYLSSLLFVFYTLIAAYAYFQWLKKA